LTDLRPKSQESPFDRVVVAKPKPARKGNALLQLGVFALSLGTIFAANTYISIPDVEFGSGVASFPECIKYSVVDFDLEVTDSGTTISALDISNLNADCNGMYLRISLVGAGEGVLGQFSSSQLGTASTLQIPVTPQVIAPENVLGVNFELSESPF
jgi:hypothetical protein